MDRPMMKCGCAAMATTSRFGGKTYDPPIPSCVVHDCIEIADAPPDLTGRTAHCAYGKHAPRPSSLDLPFFEFLGSGSREATDLCKCGYTKSAHERDRKYRVPTSCKGFEPRGPNEFDRYYCGCRGWD